MASRAASFDDRSNTRPTTTTVSANTRTSTRTAPSSLSSSLPTAATTTLRPSVSPTTILDDVSRATVLDNASRRTTSSILQPSALASQSSPPGQEDRIWQDLIQRIHMIDGTVKPSVPFYKYLTALNCRTAREGMRGSDTAKAAQKATLLLLSQPLSSRPLATPRSSRSSRSSASSISTPDRCNDRTQQHSVTDGNNGHAEMMDRLVKDIDAFKIHLPSAPHVDPSLPPSNKQKRSRSEEDKGEASIDEHLAHLSLEPATTSSSPTPISISTATDSNRRLAAGKDEDMNSGSTSIVHDESTPKKNHHATSTKNALQQPQQPTDNSDDDNKEKALNRLQLQITHIYNEYWTSFHQALTKIDRHLCQPPEPSISYHLENTLAHREQYHLIDHLHSNKLNDIITKCSGRDQLEREITLNQQHAMLQRQVYENHYHSQALLKEQWISRGQQDRQAWQEFNKSINDANTRMRRQYQQAVGQYHHRLEQLKRPKQWKQHKSTCELMSKPMLQRPLTVGDMGGQGEGESLGQGRKKRTKRDGFEEDEKMSTVSAATHPTPSGIAMSSGHTVADVTLSMQHKLSLNTATDKSQ